MTPTVARSFPWRRLWPVWLFGLLAATRALAHLVPLLLRDDLFAGDAAQHTWWLYRLADPQLFRGSLAATYFSEWFLSPPAYQFAVGTLARLFDAQHLVEVLAIALALSTIVLAARLGFRVGGRSGAAAALAVLYLTHAEDLVEGGFPRSFALGVTLAGMVALVTRRWMTFGVVVLLGALVYPPVVLTLLWPAVVALGQIFRRRERWSHAMTACVALCCLAAVALAVVYLRPLPPEIGRTLTYAEIRNMPEWQQSGRFKFFGYSPLRFYTSAPLSGLGLPWPQLVVLAALLVVTVVTRRRALPIEAWALLAGGIALWAAAHALLFRLYLPNRYVLYVFPVFAAIWAAGIAGSVRPVVSPRAGRWISLAMVIGVSVSCVVDVRAAVLAYKAPGKWVSAEGYDAALAFLDGLPKSTIVAAHPDDANAIPLRCRLDVLMNTEIALPMHQQYTFEMRRRTDAAFDLLYATDWSTVQTIAAREGIDVFLLDVRRLRTPDERPYLQPYRTTNLARIEAGRDHGFALLLPPTDRVIFACGDMRVVRLNRGRP